MKEQREFFDPATVAWQSLGGGLSQRVLSGDPRTGSHTRMLRFDAGAVTPETLTHDFWEEVWIVSGGIRDLRLDELFTVGMYACRPPGMPHGPWESPEGCITFEVRYETTMRP
ncbi:MAG: cupin domain-containing protein [Microthrixaceae bacterium]